MNESSVFKVAIEFCQLRSPGLFRNVPGKSLEFCFYSLFFYNKIKKKKKKTLQGVALLDKNLMIFQSTLLVKVSTRRIERGNLPEIRVTGG